jgi:hypothetical protein
MDYEIGAAVSLLWSVGGLAYNLLSRLTTMHQNMRCAGYRKSWVTGAYKNADAGSGKWELPLWVVVTVVGAALSWLGLAVSVSILLYSLAKDFGAPASVREFNWRLKNSLLPLPDLMQLDRSMRSASIGRALSKEEENVIAEGFAHRLRQPQLALFFSGQPAEDPARADGERKAAALHALAEEIRAFPTQDGRLSLTHGAQIEEVARHVDDGADEGHVRATMKRIREGETLTETLRARRP